ncbi:fumarylacetoacetate hydrolase family protein [Streptomyces radiopugnans]|uniref:fumarylacetoacetate hydrolase family protein n=1 Tax=Streptomyces radiopugnans TaxID=403935 RepID=UPI001FE8D495|nr:fumarylacetoacetate hydrolase family protein [Streptomyces radiopugnans]
MGGITRQRTSTADLIFGVRELIAHTSSVMTLHPGDVIATGTRWPAPSDAVLDGGDGGGGGEKRAVPASLPGAASSGYSRGARGRNPCPHVRTPGRAGRSPLPHEKAVSLRW